MSYSSRFSDVLQQRLTAVVIKPTGRKRGFVGDYFQQMNPHVVFSVRLHREKNKPDLAFKKRSEETREVVFQRKQVMAVKGQQMAGRISACWELKFSSVLSPEASTHRNTETTVVRIQDGC